MTRTDLHKQLSEKLYLEDFGQIDIVLATMIANKLEIGDPVWLMLVGASSGGKSQIMRPIANATPDDTRRIDDLTENTFISGQQGEKSLLFNVGTNVDGKRNATLLISDMTVIFSKGSETRNAILSQFRMLFDGEFTKYFGNRNKLTWKGHMGIIAGSTPTAYSFFAEVADMGERFIYYRIPEPDYKKASDFVSNNMRSAKELDPVLEDLYKTYMSKVVRYGQDHKDIQLPASTQKLIRDISLCATKFRTPVKINDFHGVVSEMPVAEAPYRVMKQLTCIAKSFHLMHEADGGTGDLPFDLARTLKWCAYSLASDRRRETYKAVRDIDDVTIRNISSYTGLDDMIVKRDLAELCAIKVIKKQERSVGQGNAYVWKTNDDELEAMVDSLKLEKKVISEEEEGDIDEDWGDLK